MIMLRQVAVSRTSSLHANKKGQDFNYHAYIYATDNHPYRTAASGGVPFGSGLNTLSRYDWVNFRRVKWDECSNASGADCLTPKGFTFMRLALSGSSDNTTTVYVDFYNLHTDAGTEADDLTARQANINQVAAYIAAWSTGNAVVIYGDTNSRYSRTADTAIRSLLAKGGFTDAWVQLQRNGVVPTAESLCDNPSLSNNTCETVDKIFYRSSPLVTLAATAFRYESARFLQPNGSILSDHNPVYADFTWSTTTTLLQQSAFFGGDQGGTWFSDVPTLSSIPKPKPAVLTFRGAARLDGVSLTLTDGTTLSHGSSTGGTASTLALARDEYWTGAELCKGEKKDGQTTTTRNFYIRAVTSSGRSVEAGTRTASCGTSAAPEGWHIVGFLGQTGMEVDQLAFLYAPR
jgi:hypothetical protein